MGITDKETTTYKLRTDSQLGDRYTAIHYADWITPTSAKPLARYDQRHLKQFAAVTRNKFGKGIGWYVGTIVSDSAFYDKLIAAVLKDAGIRPLVAPPAGVEIALRSGPKRQLLFVINHSADEKSVDVPKGNRELLADKRTDSTMKLEPFGVAVIELPPANGRSDTR